ncbi:MAG: hypothetical protein ABL958_17385, partial [Bdellovibrionia bacterium]
MRKRTKRRSNKGHRYTVPFLFAALLLLWGFRASAENKWEAYLKPFVETAGRKKLRPSPDAFTKNAITQQRFDVYGWSPDSKVWVYSEQGDYGEGALDTGTVEFHFVERKKKNAVGFTYSEDTSPKKLKDGMTGLANAVSEKFLKLKLTGDFGKEIFKSADLHKTREYQGKVYEDGSVDDLNSTQKIAFEISNGMSRQTKEDANAYGAFLNANIAYAAVSPDGKFLVTLIARTLRGFEGDQTTHFDPFIFKLGDKT